MTMTSTLNNFKINSCFKWLKFHFLPLKKADSGLLLTTGVFVKADILCCVLLRAHSHMNRCTHHGEQPCLWGKKLWWWSTSVCSNAALQWGAIQKNCASDSAKKSCTCSHTHLQYKLERRKCRLYWLLEGNVIWYVLNSGHFQPLEGLTKPYS